MELLVILGVFGIGLIVLGGVCIGGIACMIKVAAKAIRWLLNMK